VLLNSIYFKGRWTSQFGEAIPGEFTTEDGTKQDVEYLCEKESRNLYVDNELFSMAELPYGNRAYGLLVLLPKTDVGVTECLTALTGNKWLEAINSMTWATLNLKLPKFKVEDKRSLLDILNVMGIENAFNAEADFSSLSEQKTFISDIMQANYFSIDENGTEATTITEIAGMDGEVPPSLEIMDFYVNRPFLYFIKEKSTNTILFMGKMGRI
jgi:serpin B